MDTLDYTNPATWIGIFLATPLPQLLGLILIWVLIFKGVALAFLLVVRKLAKAVLDIGDIVG